MSQSPSSVTFAETVYALSKVIHIAKFHLDISRGLSKDQRKHLRLLDDIALLLVTESKSDVAAVSLERHQQGVNFYFAKNREATKADEAHIDAMFDLVKGPGTQTERIEIILTRVMLTCQPKLVSRWRKLKATVLETQASKTPYLRDDHDGELHDFYKCNFSEWYDKYPTAGDLLVDFLSAIVQWDPAANNTDGLFELLRIAHVTGAFKQDQPPPPPEEEATSREPDKPDSHKEPDPIFFDRTIGHRMRLLGDYYGAAKRIVKHYDFAFQRQATIQIKFIPVPVLQQQEVAMSKDYVKILNRYATDRNLPKATYNTLAIAYPSRTPPPAGGGKRLQSVTHSVHAECTLAVYLASLGRHWTNIEIGCSKGSCWLCESYLSRNQAGISFHVRNVHGKLQPGWTMPPGGDPTVDNYIHTLVEDQIAEVLHKAYNPIRGDSEPRSDSDEEEKKKAPELIGKPSWARS